MTGSLLANVKPLREAGEVPPVPRRSKPSRAAAHAEAPRGEVEAVREPHGSGAIGRATDGKKRSSSSTELSRPSVPLLASPTPVMACDEPSACSTLLPSETIDASDGGPARLPALVESLKLPSAKDPPVDCSSTFAFPASTKPPVKPCRKAVSSR